VFEFLIIFIIIPDFRQNKHFYMNLISSNIYKKIYKLLKLDKALIIFDIKSTGTNISSDKIVALAVIKIRSGGQGVVKKEYLLNPEIKIDPEATAVHGIKNRDVKGRPKFREFSQEIYELFTASFYSGFNVMNFDLPILRREFIREGIDFEYTEDDIIDSRQIFLYMSPRTLSSAYRHYCKKEFKAEHTAMIDTEVSAEILLKQLERYKEVQDLDFVNRIHQGGGESYLDSTRKFYWQRGEAYFAFSKYKNKALAEVVCDDPEFLQWILEADFSDDTKAIIRSALEGRKIECPSASK